MVDRLTPQEVKVYEYDGEDIQELPRAGRLPVRFTEVIAQEQQEGLVAHPVPREQERAPEALRALLGDQGDPLAQVGEALRGLLDVNSSFRKTERRKTSDMWCRSRDSNSKGASSGESQDP